MPLVIVMVSVKDPEPVVAVFALTVILAGATPEPALNESQLLVTLAVQFALPVPAFVTWSV